MLKKILFIFLLSVSFAGFSQQKSIDSLSVAPNPFTNSTKISFTSTTQSTVIFSVKNILGKTVYRKNIKAKKGVNYIAFYKNDLLAGIYIYSIQDKRKIISKRLVIR